MTKSPNARTCSNSRGGRVDSSAYNLRSINATEPTGLRLEPSVFAKYLYVFALSAISVHQNPPHSAVSTHQYPQMISRIRVIVNQDVSRFTADDIADFAFLGTENGHHYVQNIRRKERVAVVRTSRFAQIVICVTLMSAAFG